MLAETNNGPYTVEEAYTSACSTSNMRADGEKDGQPIDAIIAAGWNDSRVGMALMRLASEWQGAAKPRRMTDAQVKALAEANRDDRGKPRTSWARSESLLWYRKELRLLAVSLKSRASVLEQLTHWALIKGHDPAMVGPALYHWLSPCCVVCDGLGRRKVPDAPALSGKLCHACNGSGITPHPEGSGRILGHIDYVVQVARQSLKARLRREG